jgi:hypothetical protein
MLKALLSQQTNLFGILHFQVMSQKLQLCSFSFSQHSKLTNSPIFHFPSFSSFTASCHFACNKFSASFATATRSLITCCLRRGDEDLLMDILVATKKPIIFLLIDDFGQMDESYLFHLDDGKMQTSAN